MISARALAAALLAFGPFAAAPGSAQCVSDLANGDILVGDLTAYKIIRIDVSEGADPNDNQQVVCTGTDENQEERVESPRAITNDREGRLWISMYPNVVRVDPAAGPAGTQVPLIPEEFAGTPPGGIVKERDGDVFLAWAIDINEKRILRLNPLNGYGDPAYSDQYTGLAYPLGLIPDPHTGAAPRDMLLSQAYSPVWQVQAGAYTVKEDDPVEAPVYGLVEPIAIRGNIAAPFRIAAASAPHGDRFMYLTDIGGLMDPDGLGPEPAVTRPAQVVQVDRTVPVDFDNPDPEFVPDFMANQKVVSAGGLLEFPVGIVVLDGDGVGMDSLLVSEAGEFSGTGRKIVRIDFYPEDPDPSASSTQTVVSEGQFFDNNWGLHIVAGIDPVANGPFYITDVTTGDVPGVFRIDPTAPESTPPQPLATGGDFVRPNGIVVHPEDSNRLIVADGGLPGVVEAYVNEDPPIEIYAGDPFDEPTNVIVDFDNDLIVTDRGAKTLFRIHNGELPSILSPVPGELDFFQSPESTGIDPDGYLLVTDSGTGNDDGRLIKVSPVTGKQWCSAEEVAIAPPFGFPISGSQDLISDGGGGDTSFVFNIETESGVPLLRFVYNIGFFGESGNTEEYVAPRGVAIAQNRDILTVDAGTSSGEGRLLRLDPLPQSGEPSVVPNSTGLGAPFGVAVDGKPRPNPVLLDTDGDGIPDLEDNCVEAYNEDQAEGNNGFGEECDTGCYGPQPCAQCDANGSGVVGIDDFTILVSQLGNDCSAPEGSPESDCSADCSGDDKVGIDDFTLLIGEIGDSVLAGPKGSLLDFDPWGLVQPSITSPEPGSELSGTSEETFEWNKNLSCVNGWQLVAGSSAGASDYFDSGDLGAGMTTVNASGLPLNEDPVCVRLYFRAGSGGPVDSVDSGYRNECATSKRVASNACVACDPGSTNNPGDDVCGPDTDCDVTLCLENHRVESNACVACDPGTTNAAGDPATGPDTLCEETLCAENERVVSNTCVACDPGTTNAAGDPATGPDTNCDPAP